MNTAESSMREYVAEFIWDVAEYDQLNKTEWSWLTEMAGRGISDYRQTRDAYLLWADELIAGARDAYAQSQKPDWWDCWGWTIPMGALILTPLVGIVVTQLIG